MMSPPIRKSFVCLMVPFAYRRPYADWFQAVDPEQFESKDSQPDRLFDYAEHLVSADPNRHEAIGKRWVMRQGARKSFGLPHNVHHPITLQVKQEQWSFSIHAVELILFETQTGFLQYHVEFHAPVTMDRQIEGMYYLKKLKNYSHQLFYEQRTSKDTSVTHPIQLSNMSVDILTQLDVKTFFEGSREYPEEALVFSAALLGSPKVEVEPSMGEYLFHMRRNFKSSYKASALERDLSGNPDILPLFDNSCWGVSLEGLCNIVTETGDEVTDSFFSTTYFHHIRNTYLYLYILALHQKYALHDLAAQASELTYHLSQHQANPTEQCRILNLMKDRIVRFMLRSSYKQVSRSTHHANLYEWIRSRLQIDDLFQELHEALEALGSFTEAAEQKQRQEEEERKRSEADRFNKKITAISAVFLPLSIITGVYGMNVPWLGFIKELWMVALLTIGAYGLTYLLFRYWFNKE